MILVRTAAKDGRQMPSLKELRNRQHACTCSVPDHVLHVSRPVCSNNWVLGQFAGMASTAGLDSDASQNGDSIW